MAEDIAFLNSEHVKLALLGSRPTTDGATVGSERSIMTKGSTAPTRSREMLTLKQYDGVWKIQSVRWQSAPSKE